MFSGVVPAKVQRPRSSRRTVLCVVIGMVAGPALFALTEARGAGGGSCKELEQIVAVEMASGPEAARLLEDAVDRTGPTCVGTIFLSMAKVASLEGHLSEVSELSDRSIKYLEAEHGPEDPMLI